MYSLIDYERTIKPDYNFKLDNFRKFLKSIGSPHKKLNNIILIAGTKGKGSTAAYIESGLRACGLDTALFTSPHLVSMQERIKINNKPVFRKDLQRLIKKIQIPAKKFRITFFEAMTAIAFLYFLEKKVDYTVLEVGLGGRLDATNVVNPKVSVITRIGFDHLNILGRTLGKIAREKAGIIHPGSYVVISGQKPTANRAILEKIARTRNRYYDTAQHLSVKNLTCGRKGSIFTLLENGEIAGKYKIKNLGEHQIENALTAWTVLNYLRKRDHRINETGIKKGLAQAQISGRCQIISQNPLTMIDSAHNPESARSLANVIKNIIKEKPIIVFGASQGKLVGKILQILLPVTGKFIFTQSKNPRRVPVQTLLKICHNKTVITKSAESISKAIELARKLSKKRIPIVITGSFYVAGEALQYYNS